MSKHQLHTEFTTLGLASFGARGPLTMVGAVDFALILGHRTIPHVRQIVCLARSRVYRLSEHISSNRSGRITSARSAFPSMGYGRIYPLFSASVTVMAGLVRSVNWNSDIVGLLLRESSQFYAELTQVQPSDLFIEFLRQQMDADGVLLGLSPQC